MSRDWKNSLFGCFNDFTTCLITWFVPCYTFGKNAENVGESCIMCALAYFVPFLNCWATTHIRGKIREQRGIQGSCINDLLLHLFCDACALCQEAQEVNAPGGLSISRE